MTMERFNTLFLTFLTLFVPLQLLSQVTVDFTVAEDTLCKGDTVQFFDQSSSSSGTIVQYEWSFEGGEAIDSTVPDPVVIYDTAAYDTITGFNVELTVTDDNGNTDTKTEFDYVHVNDLPHPVFNDWTLNNWWSDTLCIETIDEDEQIETDPSFFYDGTDVYGTNVYGEAVVDNSFDPKFVADSAGTGLTSVQLVYEDSLGCEGDTTYYTYIDSCNVQSVARYSSDEEQVRVRYDGKKAWLEPGSANADLSGIRLELYTLQGRRLKTVEGREHLRMEGLSSDLYLLRSSSGLSRKVFVEGR